ncbi:zinc finger, CCHC-type containing protein [Tanacetum coccineum]
MHFFLSKMNVVYVLTTHDLEDGENATMEQIRKRNKLENDDYVCRGLILNDMFDPLFDIYQFFKSSKELWDSLKAKYMVEDASSKKFLVACIMDKLPPSWKDFKHTLKHKKDELTLVELGSHLHIEESFEVQDSDKRKSNNVASPLVVNMVEHNNSIRYNDNKGKRKHQDIKADPNKKFKLTYWKCGKPRYLKKDCKGGKVSNKVNGSGTIGSVNGSSNSLKGATFHVCKDRCWFKTYASLNDGSILHMKNESTTLVYGRGCLDLRFSSGKIVSLFNVLHVPNIKKNLVSTSILNNYGYKQVIESNKFVLSKHGVYIGFGYLCNQMFRLNIVNDNIGSTFIATSKLNDSILWHARLGHIYYKRMQDMSKDGFISAFDMDTEKCKTCMLNKITKKPFQNIKRETGVLELIHSDLCDLHATPSLGNKEYFVTFIDDASRFCYVYLLHITDEALDIFKVFKTEVELQQGSLIKRFKTDRGGEYMNTLYFQSVGIIHEMTAPYTPQQNRISERKNRVLKEMVNSMLSYSRPSQGAVVRLPDPKLKTLGERGIECIFVGYTDHSKAFRFYFIDLNERVSINSIIESMDVIFDENKFSSVLRPSQRSLINRTEYIDGLVVPEEVTKEVVVRQPEPELRKSKRNRTPKNFGPEFQLYLIQGTRDEDVAFWKEAINDEMDSIIGNNTWVLANLPLGCKPLCCKWIFKRKLKVDGTVEKFKARLVIHGFRKKSRIEYFDTYALVARIITIRLLIALALIQNLIIHQMDVKTAFLNGELYEEVDLTKEFLSSRFSMKDMGESDVILALEAAGKEAEWLRNLILEIPLWSKPITSIYICCDSVATLAKSYSQMHNVKSRYLGVRHNMIRKLIMNSLMASALYTLSIELSTVNLFIELAASVPMTTEGRHVTIVTKSVLSRPTGYSISEDPKEEPIKEEPLKELKEEE